MDDIKWSDIERALDDLKSYEEGVRFQRLAVTLAKQKFSGIIATEVKKDGGEDAVSHSFLTKDRKCFSVASSITATLQKVKDDAKAIHNRGVELDLLIFYTPRKVFNKNQDDWKREIKKEFGWDLLVISREDIISDLLKSENAWLCSTFLGISRPESPSIKAVADKITPAFFTTVDQWKRRARFNRDHLIDITAMKLDSMHKPIGETFNHQAICTKLSKGERIILLGIPGAGKTTTLIQLADNLFGGEQQRLPLLISLPEWIESRSDILTFVTQNPAFAAVDISCGDIALLHQSGRLVFILNGWNEIPFNLMEVARLRLSQIDREYPAAGIMVATREHTVTPPLMEALILKLSPINDVQRQAFLEKALGENAHELLGQIESDNTLSELTRIPLILTEVAKFFEPGELLPRTKIGMLRKIVKRIEASEEHSASLKAAPLWGYSDEYLIEIASSMTREARAALSENATHTVITKVSERLKADGQIAEIQEPKLISEALRAHHLLDKSGDYPTPSIHFVHQQFQELFSTEGLKARLIFLVKNLDAQEIKNFRSEVIDSPTWEESLKLLAEEISENEGQLINDVRAVDLGKNLVELTLNVDPIFASELARLCGKAVWGLIKDNVGTLLRKWYSCPGKAHKQCALAAMISTGSSDFSDIFWPLIEHNDFQIRAEFYRAVNTSFLPCLDPAWREKVVAWDEERRTEFIQELSSKEGPDIIAAIEGFAKNDPSIKVRASAIKEFAWIGATAKLYHMLKLCDDNTFKEVIKSDILDSVPIDLAPRVKESYQKLLAESQDAFERLKILLLMHKAGDAEAINLMKEDLVGIPLDNIQDYKGVILLNVLESIHPVDPRWVSEWLVQREVVANLRWIDSSKFLQDVPIPIVDKLLEQLFDPTYPENKAHKISEIIAINAKEQHAKAILQKLIEVLQYIDTHKEEHLEIHHKLYWRIRDVAKKLSIATLVNAILELQPRPESSTTLHLILDLLGKYDTEEDGKITHKLSDEVLKQLRSWLSSCIDVVLCEEDFGGDLKAQLSVSIARFGETKDSILIQKLIYADIERLRKGAEAFKKGLREGPQINGYRSRYSGWHAKALIKLDHENADQVLIPLLKDPYYEEDAALALVELVQRNLPREERIGLHPDYEKFFKARKNGSEQLGDDAMKMKKRYAIAIREHIETLKREHEIFETSDASNLRLKRLAAILARLNEPDALPLIMEIMTLPGRWDGWIRAEALEALLVNGTELDIRVVEQIIDPIINQVIKEGVYTSQNSHLMERCLCILPFTNDPALAIQKIKSLESVLPAREMRDVIIVLGQSRSKEAAQYLLDLIQNADVHKEFITALLKALSSMRFPETNNFLLSIIDPSMPKSTMHLSLNDDDVYVVTKAIVTLAQEGAEIRDRIFQLCREELSDSRREIISEIINKMSDPDATLAGLYLISDKSRNPIPYALERAIEDILIDKIPASEIQGAYNLVPQNDRKIRSCLFDMYLYDPARRHSASILLGKICEWRLDYGRPSTELRHPNIQIGGHWPPLDLC
jgi:hypothetical protein